MTQKSSVTEEILRLESMIPNLLNASSLSNLSEINVRISILLGVLNDQLSSLEERYLNTRSEKYYENLARKIKPTPAKDALDFDPDLIKLKLDVEKIKEFIRTRERTILRVEKHLDTETKIGLRQ